MVFSLVCALLLEWIRPLSSMLIVTPFLSLHRMLAARLTWPGRDRRGAWCLTMLAVVVVCMAISALLWRIHPLFAVVFNIVVLYLSIDIGSGDRFFAEIQLALRMGEIERARMILGQWRGEDTAQCSGEEVARLAIEQLLLCTHRGVLGAGFWFLLLPGPSGALLYRLACRLADEGDAGINVKNGNDAAGSASPVSAACFARCAFEILDWLPSRLTGFAFAVMGDFENAVYCARTQAVLWPDKGAGQVIASAGGALGIRLGLPVQLSGRQIDRPEMGMGQAADVDGMQNTVRLMWRALLLCLLVLVLLSIAG